MIEREHSLRFAFKHFFEALGVDVDLCASCVDAEELAWVREYTALLVDHVPDEDDDERRVIAACRARNVHVVVVMLAGSSPPTDTGADVICEKPLPLADLARALRLEQP